MGIFKTYRNSKEELENVVTIDDIHSEVDDLLKDIEYIEKRFNTVLVGDRADLCRPFIDCVNMTKVECAYFFSVWRSKLFHKWLK